MFTEDNRIIKLTTPLGENALILTSLRGREAISELFHFEVEAVWQTSSPLKFTDILGKTITVAIDDGTKRYINGIVYSVEQGVRDRQRGLTQYTLRVAPNTWVLTRNVQSRIFQQKSVPDIVKEVIANMGLSATFKSSLQGTYQPRDYCVQYRESDFAFISRLMESEGIFYFYQHDASQHTLVIADKAAVFQDVAPGPAIEFEEVLGGIREKNRIFEWVKAQEIRSGKFSQNDWNFETPSTNLLTDEIFAQRVANNQQLEIYEHPGDYMQKSDGETLTKSRLQEENTGQVTRGRSWHYGLCPGYKFALKNHFSDDGKYVLTSVDHAAEQPLDVGAGQTPFEYENRFSTIPFEAVYRPARVTPEPRLQGVQSAIVVGPGGEEIYTDKYGRVKVQFHWDREGKKDENSSCWIRVATFWAGKNWGAIHIPRIGQEVIVDFEEGDIDRPLIVGSVYNAAQMPPYALPGEKTKSTLQTRSSKGGGAANCNEIRFEDKMGSEQVLIHAEKNQDIEVENDESHWVGHDRSKKIDHDETVKVGHDHTIQIANNDTESVGNNQSITVGKDRSKEIGSNESVTIGSNQTIQVGKNLDASIGVKETREAGTQIQLTVGQSSITIDQMGVTIKGMTISIQAQVQAEVKALMTSVNGDAMTTVKGGVVMIN